VRYDDFNGTDGDLLAKRELPSPGVLLVPDAMKRLRRELGADFRAHEKDVGDPEADSDQPEQSRDVRPDEVQTLTESKRSGQDSFCLAL
jgi:hypothetical protein